MTYFFFSARINRGTGVSIGPMGWVVIAFFACIVISVMITVGIENEKNNKYASLVKQKSQRYNDLLELNSRYHFNEFPDYFTANETLYSKPQFDRFDLGKFFIGVTEDEKENILYYESMVIENRTLLEAYKEELIHIHPYIGQRKVEAMDLEWERFHRIEQEMVRGEIQIPKTEMMIRCTKRYTSPAGRNSYMDYSDFSFDDFRDALRYTEDIKNYKDSSQYQRRAMTPSLRYDVMQRDGFRCVLCGRGAEDGVKLEVDHILPVSKGGKTVKSNLRTLCLDCNRGKSDKYDFDRMN